MVQVPAWAPLALAAGLLLALAASVQVEYGNGAIIIRSGWVTGGAQAGNPASQPASPGHRRPSGRLHPPR